RHRHRPARPPPPADVGGGEVPRRRPAGPALGAEVSQAERAGGSHGHGRADAARSVAALAGALPGRAELARRHPDPGLAPARHARLRDQVALVSRSDGRAGGRGQGRAGDGGKVKAALLALAVALLWPAAASAYPTMIRHGYTQCASCHTDPSGGTLLTEYGRAQSELLL